MGFIFGLLLFGTQFVYGWQSHLRIRGVWSVLSRIMHTHGVQDMHGCASGYGAGWSMVAVEQVRLGRTGQFDGSTQVGWYRRRCGIGEDDVGA